MAKLEKTTPISDEAVQAKTGKTWPEWFTLLDAAGASGMAHHNTMGGGFWLPVRLDKRQTCLILTSYSGARPAAGATYGQSGRSRPSGRRRHEKDSLGSVGHILTGMGGVWPSSHCHPRSATDFRLQATGYSHPTPSRWANDRSRGIAHGGA